ncbi:MAG: AraC family transcriptional regulator [Sphaerochaetaceae bacterium]
MKVKERGVLSNSEVFFHTASKTAQSMFFHLLCCGNYDCDLHYKVKRNSYHSYLLLMVVKGYGYMVRDGKRITLREGSLSLIDCFHPHEYGTDTGWKILWVHFDGIQANEWYEKINHATGGISNPLDSSTVLLALEKLLHRFQQRGGANEALTNMILVDLLSTFLIPAEQEEQDANVFDNILCYINEHISENINVEKLAERACLSPYYFIRSFKREIGYTPHEYIINTRVNAAKFYLKTSRMSIKDIVYNCGFSNESSFSNTFKRLTGFTPNQYRTTETL